MNPLILEQLEKLKNKGIGGLARIHITTALQEIEKKTAQDILEVLDCRDCKNRSDLETHINQLKQEYGL